MMRLATNIFFLLQRIYSNQFMLAYAQALGVTYYAQNYASIICQPNSRLFTTPSADSAHHLSPLVEGIGCEDECNQ